MTSWQLRLFTFLCGLSALVIAFAGQLFLGSGQMLPGAILYAVAVVLAILALGKQPGPKVELAAFQPLQPWKKSRWGPTAAGGLALVTAVLAFWLFTTDVSTIVPWLLYLASIALLIVSILWVEGRRRQAAPKDHSWAWLEIGIFAAIMAIAAFMRLVRFDQVPFGTWYDEGVFGLEAIRINTEPGYFPVFVQAMGMPAHFIYLIAASFQLFGVSTLSIRAVSVAFGLGTVAAAYLTGRELFDRRIGLILAFLLAVSRWDVNWSRIGLQGVSVPFFELLTVGLILRAVRRQRLMDYTLAGLAMGLGLCFYFSLRLFPLVIGLFLLVLWLRRHDFVRSSWRGLILFGLGVFIASVPVTQLVINQPDDFWGRMNQTSIFTGKTPQEGWQAVAQTAREHLLMFNVAGDRNGRHNLPGEPMLDPIIGALMVVGIGLSLRRIRQPASFLALAWLLLMLAPGIFSLDFESPQTQRAIGSLPAAYILAVIPISGLWQAWDKIAQKRQLVFFLAPLTLVLAASGVINYDVYFNRQAQSFVSWAAFSTPETIAGKIMAGLGNKAEYYVSTFYYGTPTIRFLAPEVTGTHRLETYDTLPIPLDGKKDVVFLVDADRKPFFLQAKSYYPSASFTEFTGPDGTPVLYEIVLKTTDILASQGLTASYYRGSDWSEQPFLVRTEKNLNFDWQDGEPAPFPFTVEWKGILYAPEYGPYRLKVRAQAPVELILDEVSIAFQGSGEQTAEVNLAKGPHTVRIRTQGMAGHFELAWQPPSGNEAPIPQSAFLLPPFTVNGLLGRYYANSNWEGTPAFTQIDPGIFFYFQITPLNRPYTVEWLGNIAIPAGGRYLFGLESIDESALWIDHQQILDDHTPGQYQEAGMDLSPGFHAMRIRFSDHTGYTHIYLYWTPPQSGREIIPQTALFPPQGDPDLLKLNGGN